MIYDMIYS